MVILVQCIYDIATPKNHFFYGVKRYSVVDDSGNLFVSKYQMYLPTEEELRA